MKRPRSIVAVVSEKASNIYFFRALTMIFFVAMVFTGLTDKVAYAQTDCGISQTTVFDPNHRYTFLDPIGVLNHAVNMKWTAPKGPFGATWKNNENTCAQAGKTFVTIPPAYDLTGYSFTNNDTAKKKYLTTGTYDFEPCDYTTCVARYDPITGVPMPNSPYPDGFVPGVNSPPSPIDSNGNIYNGGWYSAGLYSCNGTKCYCGGSSARTCSLGNPMIPMPTQDAGYAVSVNVPALSSISFSSDPAKQIAAEDAIIDNIQKNGTIDIKALTPGLDDYTFHVPATNCVKISGNGPRKVVFMRGKSLNKTAAEFSHYASDVINLWFARTDPLKTYIDQFSFYADLKKNDDLDDSFVEKIGGTDFFTKNFEDFLKSQSSCNSVSSDTQYIFYHANPVVYDGYSRFGNVSFINAANWSAGSDVSIHEFSHSFSHLTDAYQRTIYGNIPSSFFQNINIARNCTHLPRISYRNNSNNKIYGSLGQVTCGCISTLSSPKDEGNPDNYCYRPSFSSLMNQEASKFNVIECGYLISAIKGEPTDKAHAQLHWPVIDQEDPSRPGCMALDTVKDGIPPPNPTPSGPSTPTKQANIGGNVTVSADGLTADNNAVQLVNTADSSKTYDISGLPSSGGTLTFSLPADIVPGTYAMRIGAFNSDWSNPISVNIIQSLQPVKGALPPQQVSAPSVSADACTMLSSNFQFGSTGTGVSALQTWLIGNGYDIPSISAGLVQKGYYGAQTAAAFAKAKSNTDCVQSSVQNINQPMLPVVTPSSSPTYNPAYSLSPAVAPTAAPSPVYTSTYVPTPAPTASYSPSPSLSAPAPSPAPTASLTIEGQSSYTYSIGQSTHYAWSSANADTFSSSYTSNNPAGACGQGPWAANTAQGSVGSYLYSTYAGCVWTVTYMAKNSKTGQSTSATVTVTVNPASPTPSQSPSASPSPSSRLSTTSFVPNGYDLPAMIWQAVKNYFSNF